MNQIQASDFPELRRVFSGYLNEDFLAEYGTAAAALRAFQEDANNSERRRFWTEARRFLEQTAPIDFNEVRGLMAHLGCRWVPPSREALAALLAETTNLLSGGRQT